jgi:hypothetical protein
MCVSVSFLFFSLSQPQYQVGQRTAAGRTAERCRRDGVSPLGVSERDTTLSVCAQAITIKTFAREMLRSGGSSRGQLRKHHEEED